MLTMTYRDTRLRYGAMVQRALREAGVSQKAAALTLGLDFGQFSRQLTTGSLSGAALWVLNPLTHGHLADVIADELQVLTLERAMRRLAELARTAA